MFSTTSAYVIGAVAAIAMLIISAIVAMLIKFRPDNSDCRTRKTWFWILAVVTPVVAFVAMYLIGYMPLRVPTQQSAYVTAMAISTAMAFVIYVLLGFILAKVNTHGKIGNWF